jgi:hypothetical protein
MRRRRLRRAGNKTIAWEKERAKLKVRFEAMRITECELGYPECWKDNALGFAHAKKRRFLKPHELSEVILCCNPCHDKLESLPHDIMAQIVREIIAKRKKSLEKSLHPFQ